jgi:ribA/ribD-fused uncharacterized protein
MAEKDFTFFWGGEFSQWHPSTFTIDNITYNCAEQYMMHKKALYFNDLENAQKIMETKSPREQKAIGRKVKNFDPVSWDEVAFTFVLNGNIEKFTQNPHLGKILLETEGTEIVEASPFDTIWGIGLGENDPDAWDKTKWKGRNLLGKVLDTTREYIKPKTT